MQAYGKVGRKGVLYPPKSLRERLGLKEGDMVQYVVRGNELVVVKISDPLKVASEFNIALDVRKAMNMIGEVGGEVEREIEEETIETLEKSVKSYSESIR
jgi:AbrB family looped-hinge helix DNA binding protein